MKQVINLDGVEVAPLFTKRQGIGRPFVLGTDEQGPYVACLLGNRNPSHLYGWYILVSPEDLPLLKKHNWCGNLTGAEGNRSIVVRRRETVDGRQFSILLSHEIWQDIAGIEPLRVCRLGHPLDYRRQNLSEFSVRSGCRGITQVSPNSWMVQMFIRDANVYVGYASSPDEGYRMYNRHLRELKESNPEDKRIQSIRYNEVVPLF